MTDVFGGRNRCCNNDSLLFFFLLLVLIFDGNSFGGRRGCY